MVAQPWVDQMTIGRVLSKTAKRNADGDAIVFPQADVRMTWSELDLAVDRVAKGLLQLGLRHGDHFGVWATNWPQWVLLQFATARIGVVLITINPSYRSDELAFTLAKSDIRGLALIDQFKSCNYDELLQQLWPDLSTSRAGNLHNDRFPKLKFLVRLQGAAHPAMFDWSQIEQMGETVSDQQLQQAIEKVQPDDPINLQYTSGTTGNPKGALLTHRNLLLNAFYAGECQKFTEADRICVPVPLYHCFGCVLGTLCAAIRGAAMIFPHECFQAAATLDAIENERCTAVYGVPTMFIAMFEQPEFRSRNLSSLRTGIMAGSPCPIELMKRVTTEMGAREITIAYGQTEASPLITMTLTDDPIEKRVGTVGRVIPGVEAKIIDPESGRTLNDGVSGELCTRGHNVMLGYYNDPDFTAKTIDPDGWLHTGDLAVRHVDGYFRITGRLKDMIIRGGENISPREIEELLYRHPTVQDVQVVGVPDHRFGEQILACIVRRKNTTISEQEICEFCQHHLAKFKTPRYVWFVESFPTTVTGKIQKFKLRQMAIDHFHLQDAASVPTA
ncbi:MAG: AMP-binding protein [Pirellulaceae bacterium]|nr:AMP-binding protein [Pirellulaceae bacterium]